jgi:cation:H+ antiporter
MVNHHRRSLLLLALAGAHGSLAVIFQALDFFDTYHLPAAAEAFPYGFAIIGAAFLLAWGVEVAQLDLPRALALSILALIAVLPEYAVDMVFAYKAGGDPDQYAHLAAANMTGANRLLIGIGWPLIFLLYWLHSGRRQRELRLEKGNTVELSFLALATFYAFILLLKGLVVSEGSQSGRLDIFDTAVLGALFVGYVIANARSPQEEPHLVGPAATIATLSKGWRRAASAGLILSSAAVILLAAEPFGDGLVAGGKELGVPEFVLVQWLAPLASEAPEVTVISILVFHGLATSAMTAVISSKVNQWTLLVGTLAVVFSIGAGRLDALPLDSRQTEEFFLTAAQSFFAVILLSNLRLNRLGALTLFSLFVVQLGLSTIDRSHLYFGVAYLVLALLVAGADSRLKNFLVILPVAFRSLRSPVVPLSILLLGLLGFF